MPAGRPSDYTPELAVELCDRLATGSSLRKICAEEDMPDVTTVMRWLARNEEFRKHYAAARELWAEFEFDNMMEIADTVMAGKRLREKDGKLETITGDMVERAKLRVDTRKWALARMMPRKFGDRMTQELTGAGGQELVVTVRSVLDKKE